MSANASILTSLALVHGSKSKEERKQDRKEAKEKRQKKRRERREAERKKEEQDRIEREWQENPMSREPKWGELASSIVKTFVELCVWFIIGSRVVFAGKVAQFNVLPTDIECMPYYPKAVDEESPQYATNNPKANIDRISVKSTEGYVKYATNIMYEINEETSKNYILDWSREKEYDPEIGPLMKYFYVVLTNVFVFWFGIANTVYGLMNTYLNESLVIFLGPYVIGLFLFLFIPITVIASTVIAAVNYEWLLKYNLNNEDDYPHKKNIPVWRDSDNIFMHIIYFWIWLFTVLFFGCTPVPYIIALYAFLSPLLYGAKIVEEKADPEDKPKNYGFLSSVQGLLDTKLPIFLLLFSFYVVRDTYKYANIPCMIMVLLAALVFLYQIYTRPKKIPGKATSNIATNDQNAKFCPSNKLTKEELMEIARDEAQGYGQITKPAQDTGAPASLGSANRGASVDPLSKGSRGRSFDNSRGNDRYSEPAPAPAPAPAPVEEPIPPLAEELAEDVKATATQAAATAVAPAAAVAAEATKAASEATANAAEEATKAIDSAADSVNKQAEAAAEATEAAAKGAEATAKVAEAATEAAPAPAPEPSPAPEAEPTPAPEPAPEPAPAPAPAPEEQTGGSLKSKLARKMAKATGSLKRRKH